MIQALGYFNYKAVGRNPVLIEGETWINQSAWDRIPPAAQEAMKQASTVRVFPDEGWQELGRRLREVVTEQRRG